MLFGNQTKPPVNFGVSTHSGSTLKKSSSCWSTVKEVKNKEISKKTPSPMTKPVKAPISTYAIERGN